MGERVMRVTSDQEDVRVPGDVGANHDQHWHSHNQDQAPSSSETIVRPDDMIRTREDVCVSACHSQHAC